MRMTMLTLASVLALGCGSPCRDQKIAAASLGGPIGIIFAAAWQCDGEPQPQPEPIAAVASTGLSAQPDLVAQPDMGTAPDLSPPPLVCGPLTVLGSYNGIQFCERDADGDSVADRLDVCPALAAGQTPDPDPKRRGCPAPRVYQIILPPAAFAAAGNVDLHDGTATSRPGFDWVNLRAAPATLSSILFFQNGGPSASNAVSFELVGQADFTAPQTTLDPCAAFKDNLHQDAVAMGREVACIARRLDLCAVDLVSPSSKIFGEEECSRAVGGGSGYSSKASAPIKLAANVASADWRSSDPQPVAGIEVQVLMGGNVKLSNWQVVATITETLR